MTPHSFYERRIRLIDAVTEYLRIEYAHCADDEGHDSILRLLSIYRADTIRLMEGRPGDLDYLCDVLKPGVRLAASLMEQLLEEQSAALASWYHGKHPASMQEAFANLLSATLTELTRSVVAIEEQHPDLAFAFAMERKAHAAYQEQWGRA